MWPNLQETADLVTFTGEILNEKLHFLCGMHCLILLLLILIIKLSKILINEIINIIIYYYFYVDFHWQSRKFIKKVI